MSSPRISVVMPLYNNAKFIEESVESVLQQTYKNFELIIIDDCSKDGSIKRIEKYQDPRIKIIRNNKNIGVAKSLNKGLGIAKGEYIARCDSDDVNLPQRLNKQLKFLSKHKDCIVVGSNALLINERGRKVGVTNQPQTDPDIRKNILIRNPIIHPSTMYRRDLISKIGSYRAFFNGVEDYDLWFRVINRGKIYNMGEILIKRRIHKNVITRKNHLKIEVMAIVLRLLNINKFLRV